jgi:hypothetical protein
MSTKRTRIVRGSHSHLRLDLPRRTSLLFGRPLIPGDDFTSDEDRREAWEHHRDRLMAELPPGRRPDAFWRFDYAMPPEAESESHAVWLLPDTSAEERRQIEAMWREEIRAWVGWRSMHGEDLQIRDWRFPPSGFVAQHRPAIEAQVAAARLVPFGGKE